MAAMVKFHPVVSFKARLKPDLSRAPIVRPASCSAAVAKPSRKYPAIKKQMHQYGICSQCDFAKFGALGGEIGECDQQRK